MLEKESLEDRLFILKEFKFLFNLNDLENKL